MRDKQEDKKKRRVKARTRKVKDRGFKWKATLPLLTPSTCHYRALYCYYNLFDRIVLLPFCFKSILLFIYFASSLPPPPQRAIYFLNWNYYPFYLLHLILQKISWYCVRGCINCLGSFANAQCTHSRNWQLKTKYNFSIQKQCTKYELSMLEITDIKNIILLNNQSNKTLCFQKKFILYCLRKLVKFSNLLYSEKLQLWTYITDFHFHFQSDTYIPLHFCFTTSIIASIFEHGYSN